MRCRSAPGRARSSRASTRRLRAAAHTAAGDERDRIDAPPGMGVLCGRPVIIRIKRVIAAPEKRISAFHRMYTEKRYLFGVNVPIFKHGYLYPVCRSDQLTILLLSNDRNRVAQLVKRPM